MSLWTFEKCDLLGGNPVELDGAKERTWTNPLAGIPTATVRLPVGHEAIPDLLGVGRGSLLADRLLKVYQDDTLRFCGPLVAFNVVSQDDQVFVSFTAAGAFWRLMRRVIPVTRTYDAVKGKYVGKTWGDPTPADSSTISKQAIDGCNGEYNTGIETNSAWLQNTVDRTEGPHYFLKCGPFISQMAVAFPGFDFEVKPIEPTGGSLTTCKIGQFYTYVARGQSRPDVVFDFGIGGGQAKDINWTGNADGLMNNGFSLPPGFPESASQLVSDGLGVDTASRSIYGLYQDIVPGDMESATQRDAMVDQNIKVRKHPMQRILVTPTDIGEYEYGTHFEPGDVVVAHAWSEGITLFDANVRIYGTALGVDDENKESWTFNFVYEGNF